MAVRVWQVSEATVDSWPNVNVYVFDESQQSTTKVTPFDGSSATMSFYEVSVIDNQGSWLLPGAASDSTPSTWVDQGGVEDLQAIGDDIPTEINGQPVLRPKVLFWWVPTDTLANLTVSPQALEGRIVGTVPLLAPSGDQPSDEITVERTSNGVIVTVPPTGSDTTIQVSVGS